MKKSSRKFFAPAVYLTCATMLYACAGSDQGQKIDYRLTAPHPLEVPPDLVKPPVDEQMAVPAPAGATYSGYSAQLKDPRTGKIAVFPPQPNIKIARDGAQRWLVVEGAPQQVWPAIREFFIANGLSIARENAQAGIIETDWAENHAQRPRDAVQKSTGKILGTRDKFRVRLERGETAGTTEIYLSHRGLAEIAPESRTGAAEAQWQPRPSDPELEAEMLHLLMAYLGMENKQAEGLLHNPLPAERAKLNRDAEDRPMLIVYDDLERAWRRVGLALDHAGLPVEDRDYDHRRYDVLYNSNDDGKNKSAGNNKQSAIARDSARYQITLHSAASATEVRVVPKNGEDAKSDPTGRSDTGEQILGLLYEQLK